MKKKVIIFCILSFIFFIIINYKVFLAYYHNYIGNRFYDDGNYFPSIASHTKALDLLERDEFVYNIGNDYVQIGEQQTSSGAQVAYYQIALDSYKKLLEKSDIHYELKQKTKENHEIVKKKIEDIIGKKSEEEQDEEEDEKKQDGDEQDQSAENKDEEKQGEEKEQESQENQQNQKDEDGQTDPKDKNSSDQDNGDENETEGETGEERDINRKGNSDTNNSNQTHSLLPAEKKQIDQYLDSLKQQGQQNMQFFNKKSSQSTSVQDTFFNTFSNNAFFDEVFDRGGEKDW